MKHRILILEDDVSSYPHLKDVVIQAGFEPIFAINGIKGLAQLEKHHSKIAYIILDYRMPEMDGMEFLERKQAHDTYKSIPVLMHTTYPPFHPKLQSAYGKGWIQAFLSKPVQLGELRDVLAH